MHPLRDQEAKISAPFRDIFLLCISLIMMNIFMSEIHFVSHSPGALVYVSYAEPPQR